MTGYRKNKAANDEVFYQHDGKRYFRTGDMGRMVEGKFLKITGRIKEQFKLENGKYVVPAPLEDVFARSPYIAQIFICGNNNPSPIALIVPNYVNLVPWCEKKGLKAPTAAELADQSAQQLALFEDPAFKDLINQEVSECLCVVFRYGCVFVGSLSFACLLLSVFADDPREHGHEGLRAPQPVAADRAALQPGEPDADPQDVPAPRERARRLQGQDRRAVRRQGQPGALPRQGG